MKEAPKHPGPINSQSQKEKLCISNDSKCSKFLTFNDCHFNNLILKPDSEVQEDVDYKLLNEECFNYLFNIYGGTDIRRWSVALMPADSERLETEGT
jgi:hypothetical protein